MTDEQYRCPDTVDMFGEKDMRYAARIDENQPDIVKALYQAGCDVQTLAAVGKGCPDLLVSVGGKNYLLEVKNPSKPKADQKLTPAQVKWHKAWRGQVDIVKTIDEALKAVGLLK